jgi:HEAT repeat protein
MDPKQIDEIFAQTLTGDYDDELPWEAVRTLHGIGSREVFDRAAEWCSSDNSLKRARGASVLAQLGRTTDHPSNNFPEECFSVVSTLVQREKEPLPLLSAIHALGHIGNPLAVPLVVEHCLHPSADVRFAVACALGDFANDSHAVEALLALMQDVDDDVRDWATFGLGVQGDLDSDEIRDALWQRTTDLDRNVREEALAGLGKRKDRRSLPAIIAELNQPKISDCVIEAAESFLGKGEDRQNWRPGDYVATLKKQFSL